VFDLVSCCAILVTTKGQHQRKESKMNTLELTANETTVLRGISQVEFSYFDEGLKAGSHTWSDEFTHEVAHLLQISDNAAGGVISSLIKKYIFKAIKSSNGTELQLTEIGAAAIERVGA
jgi:hypothetical protein